MAKKFGLPQPAARVDFKKLRNTELLVLINIIELLNFVNGKMDSSFNNFIYSSGTGMWVIKKKWQFFLARVGCLNKGT